MLSAAGTAAERNPDIAFAGPPPGKAEVWTPDEETIGLANAAIAASWSFRNGNLRPARLRDGLTGREYDQTGAEVFRLTTVKPAAGDGPLPRTPVRGGQTQAPPFPGGDLAASRFTLAEPPAPAALEDGQALEADLVSPHGVRVRWRAELRDGAHYLRQTLSLTSPRQAFPLHGVEFTDLRLPGLATVGTVLGCPMAGAGFPVRSYLVDDGWDDPAAGLWVENARRFPHGFAGTRAKMAPLGARLGIWISPLGGYGGAEARTAHARTMGLIPEGATLDLAHPAYRRWFTDRCLQLMREGGVNAFKWDRAGAGVSPHFMALLEVGRRLRAEDPDVFINVTVGTWPSPFWLNHVDSTWRMHGTDVGWAGKGDDREKWLTYRDGHCRLSFVEASPLYPLNSVMHHGIVHGRAFQGARVGKAGNDLRHEARSYFATGASLQELYLSPSLMTPEAWDHVAAAATWAHAHADVLRDAHWVGGDPLQLEPYGYAAWSPRAATLMVRNPDDQPRTISLDAATVFELPTSAPQTYVLRSPYPDQRLPTLELEAGVKATVTLEPFEVLVFDAGRP